mmetsp:Transcript_10899/g.18066  ORF Transcript_10899/g.18066 Transcript_10899/m.18066 type:complete len:193 (-) Transcript_10899:248-826(-)
MLLPSSATQLGHAIPKLLSGFTAVHPVTTACCYVISANILYLARRAHIRKVTMRTMLHYRTQRELGVSIPMYAVFLVAWQCFVMVYPLLEPLAALCLGSCCFYYSYPNAQGVGFILEPLKLQHLPLSKRSKKQVRLDWHKFSINVGAVGRDGYRHPPARELHRLHIDAPLWGIRHWPWRRRYPYTASTKNYK